MRRFIWAALVAILAAPVVAQERELRSIDETLANNTDDLHNVAYMSARCAGLFDGIMRYGGGNLPAEVQNGYKDAIGQFIVGAALVRHRKAVDSGVGVDDLDTLVDATNREVIGFSETYEKRFNDNYKFTGQMIEEDEVAKADLEFCGLALPKVQKLTSTMLGTEQ